MTALKYFRSHRFLLTLSLTILMLPGCDHAENENKEPPVLSKTAVNTQDVSTIPTVLGEEPAKKSKPETPRASSPVSNPEYVPVQVAKDSLSGSIGSGHYNGQRDAVVYNAPMIQHLCVSADGRLVVISRTVNEEGQLLQVWDIPGGQLLNEIYEPSGVTALTISPDSQLLAYGINDSSIIIRSLPEGKTVYLKQHRLPAGGLDFSPDSKQLASLGHDNQLLLWDIASQNVLAQATNGEASFASEVKFSSPDRLWARDSKDLLRWYQFSNDSLEFESELKLPPELRILATSKNSVLGQQQDLSLHRLSTATGEILAVAKTETSTPVDLPNKVDLIMSGAFSGQSTEFVTAANDGSLTLRSMDISIMSQFKKLEHGYVIKLGSDSNGRYWIAGTTEGGLLVLDREHPDERRWLIEIPSQPPLVAPRFSQDRKTILKMEDGDHIRSTQLATGLPDHRYKISNFKESADATYITTLLAGSEQNVYCGTSSGSIEMLDDNSSMPPTRFSASESAITAMTESPDHQVLLVGDENGQAIWFDLTQPENKVTRPDQTGRIWSIDFSSNSLRAATASQDHTVIVWDVVNREKQFILNEHKDAVQIVEFSPDDRWLVSGDRSGHLILWDMKVGKSVWNGTVKENMVQFKGIPMHAPIETSNECFPDLGITSVAFSPNQKVLAVGTANGYLQTFDLTNFRELSVVYLGQPVADLQFAEDGTSLLAATLSGDVERYWQSPDPPKMLPGHEGQVRFAALDSKGLKAVTGGHDQQLCVWDVDQTKLIASIENDGEGIAGGALSPTGNRAVTVGFGSGVVFWDLDQMRRIEKRYGHKARVWCLAFTRDGNWVASGSEDKTVKIWDFATRKNTLTIPHENSVRFVTFSPDGQQLLTSTFDERGWKYPADLQLWDSSTGKLLRKFNGHRVNVTGACFNASGTEIISCGADGQTCRWNVSTGKCLQDLTRQNGVYNPNLINDGQLLISKRFGNGIFIDEAKSLNRLAEFSVPTQSVDDLNVSPDGHRVIAATKEGRVYVWSIAGE